MTERVRHQRVSTRADEVSEDAQVAPRRNAVDYDSLLDEIDAVLETDAEEYVRSFVQKGGQ